MFVNAAREVIDFHAQFFEASTDRWPPFHNVVPVPTISSTKGVVLIKKDRAPRPGLVNFNYYGLFTDGNTADSPRKEPAVCPVGTVFTMRGGKLL